ncbi:MAG: hypothetical protein O7E52_11805 [Candidatus Poribacteria bacterium]|nr:hypothetical protein [Candidatus Poribacteria bacterium]
MNDGQRAQQAPPLQPFEKLTPSVQEQFDKAKHFIYRYGRLLDRKRFAYHFESGSLDAVIEALACYQNPDGGSG